jgi:hypothetical protein
LTRYDSENDQKIVNERTIGTSERPSRAKRREISAAIMILHLRIKQAQANQTLFSFGKLKQINHHFISIRSNSTSFEAELIWITQFCKSRSM